MVSVSDGVGRKREVRPQTETKKECSSQYGIVILILYTRLKQDIELLASKTEIIKRRLR